MERSQRLHYLDFTRGVMMLLGVLVHASHADYDLGRYEWLRFFSGSFRMACFFIISGYFAPMLLERYGLRTFLWKRLVVLGVPAMFAVLVLNPPAIAAIWEYFGTAPVPTEPTINWHVHVWFLFVLMAYMLATPLILRALGPVARQRTEGSGRVEALGLVVVTALSGVALKLVEKIGAHYDSYSLYAGVLEPVFANLPFFTLGIMMRRSRPVFAWVHSRPWLWAGCALMLLVARHSAERVEIRSTVEHLAHLGVDFACGFTCSFALLGVAQRLIKRPSRGVELVSESAYTVYIIHYLVIAVVLVQTQRWGLDVPARALIAALVAGAVGFGVHLGLVRRVRLAAFLLNGRLPASSDAPARTAPAVVVPPPAGAFVLASNPLAAAVETMTNARGDAGSEVVASGPPSSTARLPRPRAQL